MEASGVVPADTAQPVTVPVVTPPVAPIAPDVPVAPEPTNAELQAQLAALTAKLASIPEPETPPAPKAPVTVRVAELKTAGISLAESFEHLVREGYQTYIPVAEHSPVLQTLVTIVDELVSKL